MAVARFLAQLVYGSNATILMEASHRCKDRYCVRPTHIVPELREVNLLRTECFSICLHDPPCIVPSGLLAFMFLVAKGNGRGFLDAPQLVGRAAKTSARL